MWCLEGQNFIVLRMLVCSAKGTWHKNQLLYYATPFCTDNLINYIFDWNKWFLHIEKTAGNKHKVEYIMVLQWHYLKYKSLPCKSIAIRISFLKRWDGNKNLTICNIIRWFAGRNDSSNKHLMFQVLIFFIIS